MKGKARLKDNMELRKRKVEIVSAYLPHTGDTLLGKRFTHGVKVAAHHY